MTKMSKQLYSIVSNYGIIKMAIVVIFQSVTNHLSTNGDCSDKCSTLPSNLHTAQVIPFQMYDNVRDTKDNILDQLFWSYFDE